MKKHMLVLIVTLLVFIAPDNLGRQSVPVNPTPLSRIDAHVHVFNTSAAFVQMLQQLDIHVLNICVVDKYDRGFEEAGPQHAKALEIFRRSKGRAAWCSTFDPQDWERPGFTQSSISELEKTFKNGAVAVKIYKSIGMELKSSSGKYLMPDDPVFDPIFEVIQAHDRTLYAHLAEPSAAWRPLDPASPHYSYYKSNPDWHMYLHPERPSKEAILAARDHILKRHPKLRMVGCHLGSMEEDVNQISQRFDLYPNFAVDTAARVPDLMLQPREKVRDFLIKYQDRVLYATDLGIMPWDNPENALRGWETAYSRDWQYLATEEGIDYGGRKIRGLGLPQIVLRKLYKENALKWVPGIVSTKR